ncbi:MAG TPA: cytochrome P450 [Archangium sp.]|uniref:cytochrome P450 n=1 Tax=Archangium sp. TaxID=1872627 RepID=UPI002E3127AE|nr:cytochrome P450 [Archangium sp.]HEX5747718.1 cytochrome P450 [Archangium sp.]
MASEAEQFDGNPVSPKNLLEPLPLYKRLREVDPVYWSDAVHAWFITRYDDVLNCFRDPRLSANRMAFYQAQLGPLEQIGPGLIDNLMWSLSHQMSMRDGPEHIRMRRQTSAGFSPQALDAWRPAIRQTAEQLVDRVMQQGRMDVVKAVSTQLPPIVIAEFLGIPREDRDRFLEWSHPIADFNAPAAGTDVVALARESNKAIGELVQYLKGLIEERRHNPGQDALSKMLQEQAAGRMTLDELVSNTSLILFAGHTTTTDQISNGLYALLTHPEELQKLQSDLGLVKSAVEEMLRFSPAVPFMHRIASETFELRGKTIKKGDVVFMGLAAANRDPQAFPDPDRFDISRDHLHNKHMAFTFGPHHCIGAGLARRELEITFEVLLTRLPGLRLDEEQAPQLKCHSLMFRGFESLPVRW